MASAQEAPFCPPHIKTLPQRDHHRALGWYDYAEAWLPRLLGRVLDFGCNRGEMLRRMMNRSVECWGIDIDSDVLPCDLPNVRALAVRPGRPLPFQDGFFDTITILEVIEHVSNERATLAELTRVLAPGGHLLLTKPHKGLMTFIDPGNLKFAAPGFHRILHRNLLGNRDYYEKRFGSERREKQGMFADFPAENGGWHRHYSYSQIRSFAPDCLHTLGWSVYYPAMRVFWCANLAAKILSRGRFEFYPWPFYALQKWASRQETKLGDQLVILFRKAC
jgi:SAM-dependent methyltransferase